MGNQNHAKASFEDKDRRKARSAGHALLRNTSKMPSSRVEELQNILVDYFEVLEFDISLVEKGSNLKVTITNKDVKEDEEFIQHGEKVLKLITESGMVVLIKRFCELNFCI